MKLIATELLNTDKLNKYVSIAQKYSNDYGDFDRRIKNYYTFNVFKLNDEPIALSGVYKSPYWKNNLVRILDRTVYFPKGLSRTKVDALTGKNGKKVTSGNMLPYYINYCEHNNLKPFWSVYNRRRAQKFIIDNWNKTNTNYKMYQPEGLYWVCDGPIKQGNIRCWQSVATINDTNIDLVSQNELSEYITFHKVPFDTKKLMEDVSKLNFVNFKPSVPIKEKFFNDSNNWLFTGLNSIDILDPDSYFGKLALYIEDLFQTNIRVSCFKQKKDTEVPFHYDRGHEASFNIVLSDQYSPITFKNITPIIYTSALLNVSKLHSVASNKSDRIIIKFLLDNITYEQARKKLYQ